MWGGSRLDHGDARAGGGSQLVRGRAGHAAWLDCGSRERGWEPVGRGTRKGCTWLSQTMTSWSG
jgi:hypothetical protein